MIKYPLQRLLRLRFIREDKAAAEVTRRKQLLAEAKLEKIRCEKELADYREWRIEEEKRLFDAIKGKEISQKELDAYKHELLKLRGKEVQLEERIFEAQKQIDRCEQNLQDARDAYLGAVKERKKIEEHRSRWVEIEKLRQEREEEKELEEFIPKKRSLVSDGMSQEES